VFQVVFFPLTAQTTAQIRNYTLRHFTSEDGLPQNSVRAIAQDRDGFLWLATDMGLARFDGQSFKAFGKKDLGTRTDLAMYFSPDLHGRKDRIYALDERLDHIQISRGNATLDKQLLETHFPGVPKGKEQYSGWSYTMSLPDRFRGGYPISHYLFLLPDEQGSFYLWRKGGQIDLYRNWKKQKTSATQALSAFGIFRLGKNLYYDDGHGNIGLAATDSKAVDTPRKAKLTPVNARAPKPDLTKPYVVHSHDLSGKAFVYQDQKLYLLSQRSPGHIQTRILLENFDFHRNNVVSVFFDERHQRLYLGTLTNGLYILDFHIFETLTVDTNEPEANVFYSHIAFSDSSVLTPSFNVLGKTAAGQTLAYNVPQLVYGFPMNRHSVLVSRTGDIWCTKLSELFWFDGKTKKLKGKWDEGSEISRIYEDSKGRIWTGSRFNCLQYIDPNEKGTPAHIFTRKINDITYILEETPELFWVSTGRGLFKINPRRQTVSIVPRTENLCVKSLYLSGKGELWFSTFEHGPFVLKSGKLTRLPVDKNKILTNAHCIVGDKNGYLWIPTNSGLFRIYRQDLLDFTVHKDSTRLYYQRYSKKNGFHIDEFNGGCQPCAVRLKNGYLSLPSIDGLVFFNPEKTPVDVPDSKIFIDRVEADSRALPVKDSKIELTNINDVQIFVSSPYLGNRENQQLYYNVSSDRVTETKQIWYPIQNEQRSILLNNLTSGTYTLKIRKNTGFGRNSVQLTTLTIVIPYAWYETWPFKLLVTTVVLVGIYFYFKSRLKKADHLNRVLESRVSEKTRNLQDTLAVLKGSEQELLRQTRLQMHLIASISHDIRSPLRSIEFASGKVPGLIQNGDLELVGTIGSSVNESSRRVLSLLENMLSYVKSQMSGSSVAYDTFAVRNLVDEIAVVFKDSFKVQENRFVNNVPETLLLKSNRQLLKIILHNLIDNANKYTPEGKVTVSASEDNEAIRLLVTDTGAGLPEAVLHWFNGDNEIIYLESAGNGPGIHGIGLVIVKELAGMLNVRIRATSVSGATFSIEFWKA
jgi:signal transduction histidine kinase